MHKIKRPLSFVLAVLMIVGIFAAVPFTASAAAVTPKYKVTVNGKSVTNSTTLPYTTTATNLKNKAGYSSYSVTYLKVYKAMDNIGTISGQNFTINKHGSEQLDIGLKKGSTTGHITPKVVCTPITPCVCEVTGYTGIYDGEAHTIEGLTVTSPESGATVKYGTVSGTYNLTEPPTFTDVGTHTVYYQVSASGWVTKTGTVDVVINPKPVTVTAIAQSKIRGADDPEFTYTVDGLLGEDALTGELAREQGEGIGEYAILQGTLAVGSNYTIEYTGANLTIEPNADDLAAAEASAKINAIGTVEYTDASKEKIDAARAAYDALTDAQKALVSNDNILTAAEARYAELESAALAEEAKDWQSVTIADQILINFLLNTAEHANMQSITITYMGQDKEVESTVYVDPAELESEGGFYKVPAVVAPAQIGDTIKVVIEEMNGETEYSTSIADYCKYLLDGDFSAEVKALAKATLEYGQAANDYFYGVDYYDHVAFADTANAQAAVDAAKAIPNKLSATGDARSKITSASLMVLTKPEFRFYTTGLTEKEAIALNRKITVTNKANEIVETVNARFVKSAQDNDVILLEVTGIEAANLDEVYTVTIDDFGTVTFSGNDFARMLANNSETATLGAALYLYGKAAKACFEA